MKCPSSSSSLCLYLQQVRSVDRDDSFIFFLWCCLSTCDSRLPLSGAVQLIYAQLGASVTLDPPAVADSEKPYFTWYFGEIAIAWRNPFRPLPTKGNHFVSIVTRSHKQLNIVKLKSNNFKNLILNMNIQATFTSCRADASFSMSDAKLVIRSVGKEHFGTFACTVQGKDTKVTYRILQLTGKNREKEKCHNHYKYFA